MINKILEAKLVEFRISRAWCHGCDLKETIIVRIFKMQKKYSNTFLLKWIKSLLVIEKQIKEHTERYIEICRFFYSLFSLSRTLWWKMSKQIIDELEIGNKKALSCRRNQRLSMKLVKIYGIDDHLSYQIKKYNGIGYFIEIFIATSH